ncbi:MAG: haloacid dehalogenase-like hydrolase, partial [Planctomycetaceae bacterium]
MAPIGRWRDHLTTWLVVLALPIAHAPRAVTAADAPLPSWHDGPAKRAILGFVRRVSDEASPDHVPETERIAVFDNDGTLWPEVPLPFQVAYITDTLRRRLDGDPSLRSDPMVTALLAGDVATLMRGDRHEGLLHVAALTHGDLTVDDFRSAVTDWLATARHPRLGRRYDELTYLPMQEVLKFLRDHGFKTWIVSGGGADFMRVWSERVYGVPPEQVG